MLPLKCLLFAALLVLHTSVALYYHSSNPIIKYSASFYPNQNVTTQALLSSSSSSPKVNISSFELNSEEQILLKTLDSVVKRIKEKSNKVQNDSDKTKSNNFENEWRIRMIREQPKWSRTNVSEIELTPSTTIIPEPLSSKITMIDETVITFNEENLNNPEQESQATTTTVSTNVNSIISTPIVYENNNDILGLELNESKEKDEQKFQMLLTEISTTEMPTNEKNDKPVKVSKMSNSEEFEKALQKEKLYKLNKDDLAADVASQSVVTIEPVEQHIKSPLMSDEQLVFVLFDNHSDNADVKLESDLRSESTTVEPTVPFKIQQDSTVMMSVNDASDTSTSTSTQKTINLQTNDLLIENQEESINNSEDEVKSNEQFIWAIQKMAFQTKPKPFITTEAPITLATLQPKIETKNAITSTSTSLLINNPTTMQSYGTLMFAANNSNLTTNDTKDEQPLWSNAAPDEVITTVVAATTPTETSTKQVNDDNVANVAAVNKNGKMIPWLHVSSTVSIDLHQAKLDVTNQKEMEESQFLNNFHQLYVDKNIFDTITPGYDNDDKERSFEVNQLGNGWFQQNQG